jgi:hypothetical protein
MPRGQLLRQASISKATVNHVAPDVPAAAATFRFHFLLCGGFYDSFPLHPGFQLKKSSVVYRSKIETGISVSVFFNLVHRYFGVGSVCNPGIQITELWY